MRAEVVYRILSVLCLGYHSLGECNRFLKVFALKYEKRRSDSSNMEEKTRKKCLKKIASGYLAEVSLIFLWFFSIQAM